MKTQATRKLTPKEISFIGHFTAAGAPTFHDGILSATAASYPQPQNASWKLLRRPPVVVAIDAIDHQWKAEHPQPDDVDLDDDNAADDAAQSTENIRQQHRDLLAVALQKGDLSAATRNIELLGKTLGAYRDQETDPAQARAYTEAEIVEGHRLARMLIQDRLDEDYWKQQAMSGLLPGREEEP